MVRYEKTEQEDRKNIKEFVGQEITVLGIEIKTSENKESEMYGKEYAVCDITDEEGKEVIDKAYTSSAVLTEILKAHIRKYGEFEPLTFIPALIKNEKGTRTYLGAK